MPILFGTEQGAAEVSDGHWGIYDSEDGQIGRITAEEIDGEEALVAEVWEVWVDWSVLNKPENVVLKRIGGRKLSAAKRYDLLLNGHLPESEGEHECVKWFANVEDKGGESPSPDALPTLREGSLRKMEQDEELVAYAFHESAEEKTYGVHHIIVREYARSKPLEYGPQMHEGKLSDLLGDWYKDGLPFLSASFTWEEYTHKS